MLRKRLVYLALCLLVLSTLFSVSVVPVHAEQQVEIYVTDLTLNKDTYASGETVTGSFVLSNPHPEMNVPDVMYKISLGGEYAAPDIPRVYYDTKTFGPVFMHVGEQNKLVTFEYKLPATFSGTDLGIHVRAVLKSGQPLGWANKPIKVTGGMSTLTIDTANVVVDGKIFSTKAGPMIYKDKSATLDVIVSNKSKESLDLTPRVKVYDRSNTGALLKTYDENDVVLRVGAQQKLSYTINTLDYKPGVYLGELTFVDDKDIARSIPVSFRYIVAGDIATIIGMTSDTTTATKGEVINLTLNYAGTPYDITTGDLPVDSVLDIDMKVFNEQDRLVAMYAGKMNFNEGTSKTFAIKSMADAKALRANVVIKKDETIVDTYSTNLSPDYDALRASAPHESVSYLEKLGSWKIVVPVLIFILLIIGFILLRKKMLNGRMSVFIVGLIVTGGIVMCAVPHETYAFTYTLQQQHREVWNYLWENENPTTAPNTRGYHPFPALIPWYHVKTHDSDITYTPIITVNSPTNNQTMNPGQSFYVTGTLVAAACLNTPQDMMIKITFQNTTRTQNFYEVNEVVNDQHAHGNSEVVDYSIGPFTAPTASGSYNISIHVESYSNIPNRGENVTKRNSPAFASLQATPRMLWSNGLEVGTIGGEATGYQTIMVAAPTPTVNLNANPLTVNYNNPSLLTWSSTNATSCTGTGPNFSTNGATQNSTGVSTGPLTTARTFSITCVGPGGTAVDDVTVNVTGVAAPTVTLVANPTSVISGSNSNLTWTSTNATSCTASASPTHSTWTGSKALNGTQSTGPLTVTKVFSISCTGPGGTIVKNATVNVNVVPLPPTLDLTASPTSVTSGSSSTLSWTSTNATSCTASANPTHGTWTGAKAVSGNQTTGALTSSKVFTLNCTGPGGDISDSVTVTVTQAQVSVTLDANDYTLTVGDTSPTLTWDPNNAVSCTAIGGYGWTGSKSTSGGSTQLSTLPVGSHTFQINCVGSGTDNTASDSVTITVNNAPITGTCAAYASQTSTTPLATVTVGTSVTWKMSQAFGRYDWSGTDLPLTITLVPYTTLASGYANPGIKSTSVTVYTGGNPVGTINCQDLTVRNKPIFEEI